jgi:hypothetical protein
VDAAVIEAFADAEAALRARSRLERSMLLDVIGSQRLEITRLQVERDGLRAELRRYTANAVQERAA